MRKASAILVGDLHATDRQPICRTDDFKETQMGKLTWLKGLWRTHGECLVIQAGDVFDTWKATPWTISMLLEYAPPMITIPGNHDLPYHGMCMYGNSALRTVEQARRGWRVLTGEGMGVVDFYGASIAIDIMPWGVKEPVRSITKAYRRILLAHVEITDGGNMPGWEWAVEFLKRFTDYDLILTGHNHRQFISMNKDCILINPGSFTRQSASETHEPSVYLYYADDNHLERLIIPHDPSAVSREHLELKKDEDALISDFIQRVKENSEGVVEEVSFLRNLQVAVEELEEGRVKEEVKRRLAWTLSAKD